MPMFTVQVVESRDLVYEIEADSEEEAVEIAMADDGTAAVRDQFRERTLDWSMPS